MLMLKTFLFAFIIFCEARGEPLNTKLAVGETLEYRSHSPKLIFGKNQYSFKVNKLYFDDLLVIHECLAAGFLSANGLLVSGIGKKSHFHSLNVKPKSWNSLKLVGKSGKLKFYIKE